jgi:hypothetical protein
MLCFMGHALMENRSGLIVQADLTRACGHAERCAALDMIDRHAPGYDNALRQKRVTPHVARKSRHSAIVGRTARHAGYVVSQKYRKNRETFRQAKTVGDMAQTTYRGVERVRAWFTLTMAACNLARLPRLLAA